MQSLPFNAHIETKNQSSAKINKWFNGYWVVFPLVIYLITHNNYAGVCILLCLYHHILYVLTHTHNTANTSIQYNTHVKLWGLNTVSWAPLTPLHTELQRVSTAPWHTDKMFISRVKINVTFQFWLPREFWFNRNRTKPNIDSLYIPFVRIS